MDYKYSVGQKVLVTVSKRGTRINGLILARYMCPLDYIPLYTVILTGTPVRNVAERYIQIKSSSDFTPSEWSFDTLLWALKRGILKPLEL